MDDIAVKRLVAKLLKDEVGLTEIQNILANEHGVRMTFLDLRLMASELEDVDWDKFSPEEEATEDTPAPEDALTAAPGSTVVEMNKVARPGALASGSVTFASGAQAEWILDQLGRLALDKKSGEPTPEDLQDFQVELQNMLSRGAM